MVAVPDIIPLGIIDIVPNLMAVELPARRADHSVGEGVLASAPVSLFEPLGELLLDLGKGKTNAQTNCPTFPPKPSSVLITLNLVQESKPNT